MKPSTTLLDSRCKESRRFVIAALASLLFTVGAAQAQPAIVPPAAPWPPELGEAFHYYYTGDFVETSRLCLEVQRSSQSARVRREARTLVAMTMMRQDGRDNWNGGRALLAELTAADPSLLSRPECQMAYGIAQTNLHATADAIQMIRAAIDAFEKSGRPQRAAEACVHLARAWARHSEWELEIPDVKIRRPDTREDADRIRRTQLDAVRERMVKLDASTDFLAQFDLVKAQYLLKQDETSQEALDLLAALTAKAIRTHTAADAALLQAGVLAKRGEWEAATTLYQRIERAGLGKPSLEAEQRRKEIVNPQIELELPDDARADQPLELGVRTRNIESLTVEVRRVDLEPWLTAQRGQFIPAQLPVSGAVLAATERNPQPPSAYEWWDSSVSDKPVVAKLPPGAAVVVASGRTRDGRTLTSKKLLIVGDLHAAMLVGRQRLLLWCNAPTGTSGTARFWMHGSFVARTIELTDGFAVFDVPADAAVLRDQRWTCLVTVGDQTALCHGRLHRQKEQLPAVALVGGPYEPRVGQELRLAGLLLAGGEKLPTSINVELQNAVNEMLFRQKVPVCQAGTFGLTIPVTPAMEDEYLNVTVRAGNQALDTVFTKPSFHVRPADTSPLRVTGTQPSWLPANSRTVVGEFAGTYPWGGVASEASTSLRCYVMRLPTNSPWHPAERALPLQDFSWADTDGHAAYVRALDTLKLTPGPLAVSTWLNMFGWDYRGGAATVSTLVGPEKLHLWIEVDDTPPTIGEPIRTRVGCCDPAGLAVGVRPTLTIRHADMTVAQPELLPSIGAWESECWRASATGEYEITATLRGSDDKTYTARETLTIGGGEADTPPVICQARLCTDENERSVAIHLQGASAQPLLVALTGQEPLAASRVPAFQGSCDLKLELPPETSGPWCVVVCRADERGGVQILAAPRVETEPAPAPLSLIVLDSPGCHAGGQVAFKAQPAEPHQIFPESAALLRLYRVPDGTRMNWAEIEARTDLPSLPGGIQLVDATTMRAPASVAALRPALIRETVQLDPMLATRLFEGETIWCGTVRLSDQPESLLGLPGEPGHYRLEMMQRDHTGRWACSHIEYATGYDLQYQTDETLHMWAGDRLQTGLRITNGRDEERPLHVELDGAATLQVDRMGVADTDQQTTETSVDLSLARHGSATATAMVEAVANSPRTPAFKIEMAGSSACVPLPVTVAPMESTANADADTVADVSIARTLYRLDRSDNSRRVISPNTLSSADAAPQWIRTKLAEDERITPGTLLLVEEHIVAEQDLRNMHWLQDAPANCHTHAQEWPNLRQIDLCDARQATQLSYSIRRVPAGRKNVHQYVLVAMRPGACSFPAPRVLSGTTQANVTITTAPARIIVEE